jgi:hypothetical protein
MRIRQRPQQDRVNDAKDRSVRSDTQRKDQNGDDRKPGLLQQLTEREL